MLENGPGVQERAILKSELLDSVRAKTEETRPELEAVLSGLPRTECERKTACCALLPQMSLVEASLLAAAIASRPAEVQTGTVLRIVEYFMLNAAQIMGCPFLEDKACLVYPARPFGCRAYGLWSPRAYRLQSEQAVKAKKLVAKAWASLGVKLPKEVLNHKPQYCLDVEIVEGGD